MNVNPPGMLTAILARMVIALADFCAHFAPPWAAPTRMCAAVFEPDTGKAAIRSTTLLNSIRLTHKRALACLANARYGSPPAHLVRASVPFTPALIGAKPPCRTLPTREFFVALNAYHHHFPVNGGAVARASAVARHVPLALVYGVALAAFLAQQNCLRAPRRMKAHARTVAGWGRWSRVEKRLTAMSASGGNRNCHRGAILSAKDTQQIGRGASADTRSSTDSKSVLARCHYSISGIRKQETAYSTSLIVGVKDH
jgi:hypothetical protein